MKITLINHTPRALETLLFTKGTRLMMSANGLDVVESWTDDKKKDELRYMLGTIKSSWEMIDFIFYIEGVTRAFTHQLVRHRVGTAFAQQTQRAVNMADFEYVTTGGILADDELKEIYDNTMHEINSGYSALIEAGANAQDARGVLPTNVCTNIVFKANLRTLHHMCGERLCVKAQGEFQNVMREIRRVVVQELPWTEPMLRVFCATNGTCCFPNYMDCPIKGGMFNPDTGRRYDNKCHKVEGRGGEPFEIPDAILTKEEIQKLWEVTRAEAQPTGMDAPKEAK
jgi:flavin-dependent thymidylate synthase